MFSHNKDNSVKSVGAELHSSLYIRDTFCISDEAFHEICMIPSLPKSGQVKRLAHEMNSKYEILKGAGTPDTRSAHTNQLRLIGCCYGK